MKVIGSNSLPHKPTTNQRYNQPADSFRPVREINYPACLNKPFHKSGKGPGKKHQQAVTDGVTEQKRDTVQNLTLTGHQSQ